MMPFIPYGKHHVDSSDIEAVVDILENKFLTQGPTIEAFENTIADYVGAKYAVAVSSGTAALHLCALAAGIELGRVLITTPVTFVASANAALYAGGQVAFADIDPASINMSPDRLAEIVSDNTGTQAVVPVHFAGLPCDMPAIEKAAAQTGAVIIEDASHALGSLYPDGKRVGCCASSDMTVFSFHPVKAIAAGEGGMITTNDEKIYRQLIRLRSHGINKLDDKFQLPEQSGSNGVQYPWYYEMQELGFNYRITDIQCALALSQFKKLDRFVARRRELVRNYDAVFSEMEFCRPAQLKGIEQSSHHLYVLRIDFDGANTNREELMLQLREKNIGTQVHYIPIPVQPYYQRLGFKPDDYTNAQAYYREALSIPLYYDLTDEQQQYVIMAIQDLLS